MFDHKPTKEEIEKEYEKIGNPELSAYWSDNIPDKIYNMGIRQVASLPNMIDKDNYEFLSIKSWGNGNFHQFYVSIYEPKYIIDDLYDKITRDEIEALYDYTSSHWDDIINNFKEAYNDEYNLSELSYSSKNPSKIIYPSQSPDYRLLSSSV